MTIQSIDNLISAIGSGQTTRYDWNKVTTVAGTLGGWFDFSGLAGLPVANAWAGTALNWRTCDESTGNGTQIFGMPHGGNVSALKKHLLNMNAWGTAATAVPGTLMLIDMQGYYPGFTNNSAVAQNTVGTPTLRYTNGEGVRAYMVQTATGGAGAQNFNMSYTDQGGTTGNTMPVTVACTASSVVSRLNPSGVAANNYGPFLPLANGDSGIRSIESVTLSAATTGTFAMVLARPLATITLSVAGLMTEKDLLNQIPSLPEIKDGACLTWLWGAGAATATATTFAGGIEVVWG
jgi:hypothetical protein